MSIIIACKILSWKGTLIVSSLKFQTWNVVSAIGIKEKKGYSSNSRRLKN